MTTTLNGAFGAKVVAGGTGVLLNNEMDDTTVLQVVLNVVDHGMDRGAATAFCALIRRHVSAVSPLHRPALHAGAAP